MLALASLPSFDPNRISEANVGYMFNRVTNQVYDSFQLQASDVAAGIDAGTIRDRGRRYPRPHQVGGFTFRDLKNYGASLNTPEMLMHSSNVVTAHMVRDMGPDRLKKVMADLGMNERPHIELPAKGFPLWHKGDWPLVTAVTVGYGHGLSVTPLHLASAYAAMVNGGIWRPATVHKVTPGQAHRGRRVFKASTSARMRQLLRTITLFGTGKKADAPGYRSEARRAARKAGCWRLQETTWSDLRRRLPDGPPALCGHRHARRAQGTVAPDSAHARDRCTDRRAAGSARRADACVLPATTATSISTISCR